MPTARQQAARLVGKAAATAAAAAAAAAAATVATASTTATIASTATTAGVVWNDPARPVLSGAPDNVLGSLDWHHPQSACSAWPAMSTKATASAVACPVPTGTLTSSSSITSLAKSSQTFQRAMGASVGCPRLDDGSGGEGFCGVSKKRSAHSPAMMAWAISTSATAAQLPLKMARRFGEEAWATDAHMLQPFRTSFGQGQPVVVGGVDKRLREHWIPVELLASNGVMKLSSGTHLDDLMSALPFGEYTRHNGVMNLSSHLPAGSSSAPALVRV